MPLLIIIGLVIFVGISQARIRPGWQTTLSQYLVQKNTSLNEKIAVKVTQKARQPWQLDAEMGQVLYKGGYFQGPVPYPADDVWCVLLEQRTRVDPGPAVVFVARHSDMYYTNWVVQGPRHAVASPEFTADLERLGCDLTIESAGS
jgi:hypothetical protein